MGPIAIALVVIFRVALLFMMLCFTVVGIGLIVLAVRSVFGV